MNNILLYHLRIIAIDAIIVLMLLILLYKEKLYEYQFGIL